MSTSLKLIVQFFSLWIYFLILLYVDDKALNFA